MVDFFDPDSLSRKGYAEIDLLAVQAKTSAAGDHDGAVVDRVVRLWDAAPSQGIRTQSQINRRETFLKTYAEEKGNPYRVTNSEREEPIGL